MPRRVTTDPRSLAAVKRAVARVDTAQRELDEALLAAVGHVHERDLASALDSSVVTVWRRVAAARQAQEAAA